MFRTMLVEYKREDHVLDMLVGQTGCVTALYPGPYVNPNSISWCYDIELLAWIIMYTTSLYWALYIGYKVTTSNHG